MEREFTVIIEEDEEGITKDELTSVVASAGVLSPTKGFLVKLLTDNKKITAWLVDRYLDYVMTSPVGLALAQFLTDRQEARAAMLGEANQRTARPRSSGAWRDTRLKDIYLRKADERGERRTVYSC